MRLVEFEIVPDRGRLPAPVDAFLADARTRIDQYFVRRPGDGLTGFVPSDYEVVYRSLSALRREHGAGERLCEWGSGFGVVVGLAAWLGFEAHGIELDCELVDESRRLLAGHRLDATIVQGSFVPQDYAADEELSDLDTQTVLSQADVYGELDLDVDDFAVVFAYPWPTEEELYCDLFARYADPAAVLMTWSRVEGVRSYRRRTR